MLRRISQNRTVLCTTETTAMQCVCMCVRTNRMRKYIKNENHISTTGLACVGGQISARCDQLELQAIDRRSETRFTHAIVNVIFNLCFIRRRAYAALLNFKANWLSHICTSKKKNASLRSWQLTNRQLTICENRHRAIPFQSKLRSTLNATQLVQDIEPWSIHYMQIEIFIIYVRPLHTYDLRIGYE